MTYISNHIYETDYRQGGKTLLFLLMMLLLVMLLLVLLLVPLLS